MRNDRLFLALPETAQRKDGFGDAGVSERKSLLRQSYSEPRCAGVFERPCALNRAVTIGVRLNRSQD